MKQILLFTVCLAFLTQAALAAEKNQSTDDEGAVRSAIASYVAAFNKGDAAAVAAHWSKTGEWFDPDGVPIQGRDAILTEMKTYFAGGKKPQIELLDLSVQFLAPSVAVVSRQIKQHDLGIARRLNRNQTLFAHCGSVARLEIVAVE